mgnify:CR=1 FL=1
MSMQTTAVRALTHLFRAGQSNPQVYLVALPVIAVAGAVYGASELYKYTQKRKEGKESEAFCAALSSGNR